MGITLEQFKTLIAQPEGQPRKVMGVPFSKHDSTCHLQLTGRHTRGCKRCETLTRRKARKRKTARRMATKPASMKRKREKKARGNESVFTVSGGLPSLGKNSR